MGRSGQGQSAGRETSVAPRWAGMVDNTPTDDDDEQESCLALATNLWQSDTVWNDIACYHQKEWICEDSDQMLKDAGLA